MRVEEPGNCLTMHTCIDFLRVKLPLCFLEVTTVLGRDKNISSSLLCLLTGYLIESFRHKPVRLPP